MKKITIASFLAAATLLMPHCTKPGAGHSDSDTLSANGATSLASIGQSAFSLWGTCGTDPYDISGTNGICVPVGGTSCSSNDVGAQQSSGQTAVGMSFYGCFKGGSNAPDGSNEMAVFICDNVTTWNGQEMGFIETLSDHTLKGYIQGGGNYIYQVISTGDNSYHTWKCQVNSGNNASVDFYQDGTYLFTLTNSGNNYNGNYYYFVGTTHRTSSSWSSTGEQVEMYDMTTD
jgi:hypothetical protein